jgi:hypothetical protein
MGKIDHTHHAEDQVEAARHQRVDAAQQNAANQEIRYRHGTAAVGNEAAWCARLGSKRLEHAPGMVPPWTRLILSRQLLGTLLGVKAGDIHTIDQHV